MELSAATAAAEILAQARRKKTTIESLPDHLKPQNLDDAYEIQNALIPLIEDFEIKLKWGVSPLITHPSAINPSNFIIFFDIITGISKTPGA